jgi:AraC-like DNA-binding protein
VLHVKGDAGTTVRWLEANLQFVASEMAAGEPGFETIVSRLADILVVQAVRAHVAQTGGGCKGWLRALVDPQISRALSLIHEKPEDDWTVESLASKVGMSRSAFAARFAQLVEEPPLTYLTRWRMQKASRLLETSPAGVAEVAKRVGYDAEAAFSKAFKRWIGVARIAARRNGGVIRGFGWLATVLDLTHDLVAGHHREDRRHDVSPVTAHLMNVAMADAEISAGREVPDLPRLRPGARSVR